MDKIYRVNMSDLSVTVEAVPDAWKCLGGRGLTSTIVAAEVPPTCHPLGPNNKLVFAPGLFTGTAAVSTCRLSAGAKSPLTGGIKESSAGGTSGQLIAKLGVKALIIEGKPKGEPWYSLHVNKDGITISQEHELIGKGNYAVVQAIEERLGKKAGVITIGPVGEMRMQIASMSVKDRDGNLRCHGRGGLGAVMGSKRIKFITVDDEGAPGVKVADPEAFNAAAKTYAKILKKNPITGEALKRFGTNLMVSAINEAGAFPTRNFTSGRFEGSDKISGETMYDTMVARGGNPSHTCSLGCIIQCSQEYVDQDGKYITSGFEYETIWSFGGNCCIDNLDDIAKADHVMDDIGIDSIDCGGAFAIAMEAGILPFGDGKGVIRILDEEVRTGTPLGRIIGSGTASVGKLYGATRVPVVKGQSIPAYDPRGVKGIGVTYAMGPMGADHTQAYLMASNLLGIPRKLDPLSNDGQVEMCREEMSRQTALDTAGICHFVALPAAGDPDCVPAIIEMLNAQYGLSLTVDDFLNLGKSVLRTEHGFNLAAGLGPATDRLPEFMEIEPLAPHNGVWDMSDKELQSFWDF